MTITKPIHFLFITLLFFSNLISFSVDAQNMADYTGSWEGKIENSKAFNLKVEIENFGLENSKMRISNYKSNREYSFRGQNTQLLEIQFSENLYFEGVLSLNGIEINGFIKSGFLFYHIKLLKVGDNTFAGTWNILMVDELLSQNFYLSLENGSNDKYEAYPILGDNRFTGTWCDDFQKDKDEISFFDFKTGLRFMGKLEPNKIQLEIFIANFLITQIDLIKSTTDWEIGGFHTENIKSELQLTDMENLISKDSLPNAHAVLVSKNGTLIYENYFDGYNANIPHDMRSASKSISSAIVGIANDQALIKNVEQSIFDFLPEKYQKYKDSLKAKIDIQSLLTMSSGLDADDYVKDRISIASESNYQSSKDWEATVLSAPMIHSPNTNANYGSANPFLLGIAVESVVDESLELFMDYNLFQRLEISNYIIQSDLNKNPYFGGGMYLRPRDMVKFGELYLNEGEWYSKQIISRNWVKKSFKTYHTLNNVPDKNGYGYLWWHNTYKVKGRVVKSIEARGNGGQYIFIIPSLNTVVVITSGNFRNGKTQQPELIFEKHILPFL